MNWYCKNRENLLIMVAVVFILLMIVDVIWGRKTMMGKSEKLPLFAGLTPTLLCLIGLIAMLPVWFAAREIFAVLINPGSPLVWCGWVYAVKTIWVFLLTTPLLFMFGIAFTLKTFLLQTWLFN